MPPTTPHPLRIFLCHSVADKAAVRELYRRLKVDGYNPWLDEKDILPGQEWRREIPIAVRASDIVIVCLSRNAVTKEGYVHKEIRLALDVADEQPEGSIFIIPARLEECEVPSRLTQWHWVDLYDTDGYERLRQGLELRKTRHVTAVESDADAGQKSDTSLDPESGTTSVTGQKADELITREKRRRWLLAFAVFMPIAILAMLLVATSALFTSQHTIESEISYVEWGCEETRQVRQKYALKPNEQFVSADWILLGVENAKGYTLVPPQYIKESRTVVGDASFRGLDRTITCPAGGNARVQMQVIVKR